MRITNRTMAKTYLNDLNRNLQNMSKCQDQLSSGKEIRRPSDDPFNVSRSIDLNSTIERNNQYLTNIQDGSSWIKTTDETLGNISDQLMRLGTLVNASANGTNSDAQYYAYKTEIEQIINGIADLGNANFAGKYIFAGQKTTTKPFQLVKDADGNITGEIAYSGDTGAIKREISPNVVMDINVTGDMIFAGDLNNTLKSIETALTNNDKAALTNLVGTVETSRDNILKIRAEMGAKANRMEFAEKKNESETDNMTEVLTKVEDIDLPAKTIEAKIADNVYNAALMASSRVLQHTLLDFLR
jgi:flagellar hook-associated protein 3